MARTLDHEVARLVFATRALERAVHDPGPWTVEWGSVVMEAVREVGEGGVTFRATLPDLCFVVPPDLAVLCCDGEVVSIQPVEYPGDGRVTLTWSIGPASLQPA